MTIAINETWGLGNNLFKAGLGKFHDAHREAKLLGGAGLANVAIGHGGVFDNLLNMAGIACVFFAPLTPFVAAFSLLRSGSDLIKAIGCLFKGDMGGVFSNVTTAVINAYCAMPQLKGVVNVLKAGALKEGATIAEKEIKDYTLASLSKKLNQAGLFELKAISKGLEKDLEGVKGSMKKFVKDSTVMSVEQSVPGRGKIAQGRFDREMIRRTRNELNSEAQAAKVSHESDVARHEYFSKQRDSAVKNASTIAVEECPSLKTTAERATKAAEEAKKTADETKRISEAAQGKKEEFEELITKRIRIKKTACRVNRQLHSLTRFEEAVEGFKKAHGGIEPTINELSEILFKTDKSPLQTVDFDLKEFIQSAAKEAYGDHAKPFNDAVDKTYGFVDKAKNDGVMETAKDIKKTITKAPQTASSSGTPTTEKARETIASWVPTMPPVGEKLRAAA